MRQKRPSSVKERLECHVRLAVIVMDDFTASPTYNGIYEMCTGHVAAAVRVVTSNVLAGCIFRVAFFSHHEENWSKHLHNEYIQEKANNHNIMHKLITLYC